MGAEAVLEGVDVWQDAVLEAIKVVAHLIKRDGGCLVVFEEAVAFCGIEVLHVDAEEGGFAVLEIFFVLGVFDE